MNTLVIFLLLLVLAAFPSYSNAWISTEMRLLLSTRTNQRIVWRRLFSILPPSKQTVAIDSPAPSSSSTGVHRIRWQASEGTVEFDAFDGETLRTAALRRGVVSPHNGRSKLVNCRGLGTCGTCAVELTGGKVEPKERNTTERLRLSFPPHGSEKQSPFLRLACQIQVHDELEVTKRSGFWGQYGSLSPSSEYETYFGDLEFILDNKSPQERREGK